MKGSLGFWIGKIIAVLLVVYLVSRLGLLDEAVRLGEYIFDNIRGYIPAIVEMADEVKERNLLDGDKFPDVRITFPSVE